jgi:4-hydroxy-tetrahydrodipicolinate reductase
MRILLLGHGRMGQLVERLAPEYDTTIAGVITARDDESAILEGDFGLVDAAIDFTLADAVPRNLPLLARRGVNVVIGTTGWSAHEPQMKEIVARSNIGELAAANF